MIFAISGSSENSRNALRNIDEPKTMPLGWGTAGACGDGSGVIVFAGNSPAYPSAIAQLVFSRTESTGTTRCGLGILLLAVLRVLLRVDYSSGVFTC